MGSKVPMPPIVAIHTAARRYCIEQDALWRQRYYRSHVDPNSEEARAIYPRYHVLDAILLEVERMTPQDFTSFDEAKQWLLLAGEVAQNGFTLLPLHQQGAAYTAMEEERARFAAYIHSFAMAQHWEEEPLPYRRTLSTSESQALWSAVKKRWGVGSRYWYPLEGVAPPNTIVFRADAFEEKFGHERLQYLLSEFGVEQVFELNEHQGAEPEYEVAVALVDVFYRGDEVYWTPQGQEWLIYVSHENSVTFSGERLINTIQGTWRDYPSYLYL